MTEISPARSTDMMNPPPNSIGDLDPMVPEQFFSRHREWSGVRALMLAVLEDGIRCLEGRVGSSHQHPCLTMRQAERWVRSADRSSPFSFANVCDGLELDPQSLRVRLFARLERGEPVRNEKSLSHRVDRRIRVRERRRS